MTSISDVTASAQPTVSQPVSATDTVAAVVGRPACPDGVSFCYGDPDTHSDPREHIHHAPANHMTGTFGDELMDCSIVQWHDGRPAMEFVGNGSWGTLTLDQVDELITAETKHLATLRRQRNQLAALLGSKPLATSAEVTAEQRVIQAETAIDRAMDAKHDGLTTHPHDTKDRLRRAVEHAAARHLARVSKHTIKAARADEAFSAAVDTMTEALRTSGNVRQTVIALITALELTVGETGA
ncbi:hypothetical protein [Streptomyces sp. NPDC006638]|uniref:DUF6907 domain-containing protein n=1 Tax=Streptomyces sp. NPDC006638 TaxID=3157183 RepID=UPI0033A5B1C3